MMPANLDRDQIAVELVKRSYENLKNYQGDYDVTHLLNSLVSLLVIPKETFYTSKSRGVEDNAISEELLTQLRMSIIRENEIPQIKLNEIVRHIRNAICHGDIMFKGEQPPCNSEPIIVQTIEFKDTKSNFKIEISIENMERLVREFCAWIIKKHS